jgi:hypothetical protein
MEPTIYNPSIYKGAGIYKAGGGIYNGRGVYKGGAGGVNPEKSFVLNIDELDLATLKQGDLQFYGTGNKSKVDGKLRLSGANSSFTRPLEDSLNYYFEIEFSIINLANWIYSCGRTLIQAGTGYLPFGVCITRPYENLEIKTGLNFDTSWTGWGYTIDRYRTTQSQIQNVKFSERCNGRHYVQSINNEVVLEVDTLIDYPNLAGDANYNTTTGNGLNKIGAFVENGTMDIISMKFERYD